MIGTQGTTTRFCPRCLAFVADNASACAGCQAQRPITGWPRDRRLGATIAGGQYRVLRRLGSGGFGTVYLVETAVGAFRRALKVLHTEWAGDHAMRDRFVHEAVVLEQIHHPNVARCYGVGTLDDEPELYLVLEYVEGLSLAAVLRSGADGQPHMDPARAVRIARQVAAGLAAAHAVDVLHRDLKPENILLAQPGTDAEQVKIIDFGIAKSLQHTAAATSAVFGTPQYMAPEQLRAGQQDARLDLWQLGAVLFAMLTGSTPYAGHEDRARLTEALEASADRGPRPSDRVSALRAYPALDDLVSRLLASDPHRRPGTAGVVCNELARITHQLSPVPAYNPHALLEALCAAPGVDAWWALCRYLLEQPPDALGSLIDAADTLIAHWPDELRLAPSGWWEELASGRPRPLWRLARTLDLSGRALADEDAAALAACPALSTISRLHLAHNLITSAGARALAASPHLAGLTMLDVSHNRLASNGLAALASSPVLARVEVLDCSANGVGADGADALARSAWRLRELRLGDNDIGPSGATALAAGPALRRLEALDLSDNVLGSDGVAAFATAREFTSLVELDLSGNNIGTGGAAALTISPVMAGLRRLKLGRNRLGAPGVELLSSMRMPALETLDVAGNELGATGAMVMASSPTVRRLKSLDVSDNALGDAGFAALLGAPGLAGLRHLKVARNGITQSGAMLVGTSPLELTSLDLSGNAIGDAGAPALGAALARTRIHEVGLGRTGMSGSGVVALISGARGRLTHVDVSGSDLDGDAAGALAELDEVRTLTSLDLSACRMDERVLGRLAAAHRLSSLSHLDLSSNRLSSDGGRDLVRALERFPSLTTADLSDNALGGPFVQALTSSSLPARCQRLGLAHNALADADMDTLVRATWPALRHLGLNGNTVSQAGAATLSSSPAMPLLATLDLRGNLLKGGVDLHSLSRETVARLESSFAVIAARGADFTARFYGELFARHPGLQPLFSRVSMRHQQQHLLAALTMVIDHLRSPDAVLPMLEALGRRHVGYRVQASHYVALTHVALDVIRETLGDAWTEETDEAWHRGLDAVCSVMLAAHRQALTAEARPASSADLRVVER